MTAKTLLTRFILLGGLAVAGTGLALVSPGGLLGQQGIGRAAAMTVHCARADILRPGDCAGGRNADGGGRQGASTPAAHTDSAPHATAGGTTPPPARSIGIPSSIMPGAGRVCGCSTDGYWPWPPLCDPCPFEGAGLCGPDGLTTSAPIACVSSLLLHQ
jgi:hypothetical protein